MAQKGINFKITAVDKTKQAFGKIGRGLKGITSAVFSFKGALAGVVGAGALGLLIRNSLQATDRLGKMSNVLGIAVKDLQTLKLASEIGGIEFETFAKATRRLTDNFGDFLKGTGEATVTFKELGISIADANALSGDQLGILSLVADRLNLVENRTLKLKYAQELFGGRGAELINVLDGGSEALKKFAMESDRFGSLNAKQVKAVEQFNDSVTRLKTVFFNVVNQFVANITPAFLHFSEVIRENVLEAIEDSNGSIQKMANIGAKDIIDFGIKTIKVFEKIVMSVGKLTVSLRELAEFVKHPFSKKNRKTIEEFNVDFNNAVAVLEKFKLKTDEITQSQTATNKALSDAKEPLQKMEGVYLSLYENIVRLDNASMQFGNTIAKSFEDAFFAGQTLIETIRNLGTQLVRLVYQKTITEPLAEKISAVINRVLGNAKDKTKEIAEKNKSITQEIFNSNMARNTAVGIENILSSLTFGRLLNEQAITAEKKEQAKQQENKNKAQGTAMLMSGNPLGFLGFMAKGGHVSAGQSYVVGEQGAEIFQPSSSGTIIPNDKIGVQPTSSINLVQEINIMPSVSDTARAEIFSMLPIIKQEAINGVVEARNRGGSVAKSLGVRR